jgi:hypothetical protein
MRNGEDVKWLTFVKNQGWTGQELYATWHIFLGLKKEYPNIIYAMAWKSTTSNLIYSGEAYKKFKALGFYDVIKLDGGGSFYFNANGTTKATSENRRINTIIEFGPAAAGDKCPYIEPTAAIRKGSKDTNGVKWAQWWLNKKGYACTIDGSFGPATDTMVRNF